MSTIAEVKLWGTTIGAVALEDEESVATFEYGRDFIVSRIEVSPLRMPLSDRIYRFPALPHEAFHGLPGLLADSLPDRFGNAVIDAWLATKGRSPESFNAVERLCYIGTRGMGALEFEPAIGGRPGKSASLRVSNLVELASDILSHRGELRATFEGREREKAVRDILRVGSSAGGARAKAIIAWNPKTNKVRSGQIDAGDGFEYWLMKFDGVSNNRDKELADPEGYGAIEFAYSKMAAEAGITMSACRLFEEGGRRHFMTRRFDRTDTGDKLHMQSLAAIAHFDLNMAGAHGYEQALQVLRELGLGMDDVEELYRRMAFNIIARNQDDHVKNIAFLMDRKGRWSLSPAFDVTYSFNPNGDWTSSHQMSMNGKRDGFTLDDFKACAKVAVMKRGRAEAIVEEVRSAVSRWRDFADEFGVDPNQRDKVHTALRLQPM